VNDPHGTGLETISGARRAVVGVASGNLIETINFDEFGTETDTPFNRVSDPQSTNELPGIWLACDPPVAYR